MKFYEELEEDDVDRENYFAEYARRILKGGTGGRGGSSGGGDCLEGECDDLWIVGVVIAGLLLITFISLQVVKCINRC